MGLAHHGSKQFQAPLLLKSKLSSNAFWLNIKKIVAINTLSKNCVCTFVKSLVITCNDPIHTELKSLCSSASPWIELAGTHIIIDVYQSTSASLLQRMIQSKINNKLHSSRLAYSI